VTRGQKRNELPVNISILWTSKTSNKSRKLGYRLLEFDSWHPPKGHVLKAWGQLVVLLEGSRTFSRCALWKEVRSFEALGGILVPWHLSVSPFASQSPRSKKAPSTAYSFYGILCHHRPKTTGTSKHGSLVKLNL
jgi:hypothetical protein